MVRRLLRAIREGGILNGGSVSTPLENADFNLTDAGRSVGVVVIGRNEGDRLMVCLDSILRMASPRLIVYVDSGSSDGSPDRAAARGVHVHRLSADRPFSAARARNEGFELLVGIWDDLEFVQFIDGDCELDRNWLEQGRRTLEADSGLAAVCGRTIERYREATIYNRLCDIEFDVPPGEVGATGGIFMIRRSAFAEVGGMREGVVAGEEPEMCLRLRRAGWRMHRLAEPMVLHDSAMNRFGQWWTRAVRGGVAWGIGKELHGHGSERYCVREVRRTWLWGLVLPGVALALAWPTLGISIGVYVLLLAVQAVRIAVASRRGGRSLGDSTLYALACVISKFAGCVGLIKHRIDRMRRRGSRIVEYK